MSGGLKAETADRRHAAAAHDPAAQPAALVPAGEALAETLNGGARVQSLVQLRQALNQGPRARAHLVLQRAVTPANPPDARALFRDATQGAAAPLPHRARMEHAFGQNLSQVRAYLGRAEPLAGLGAHAAAQGDRVAFAAASPDPALVAHEVTHVVQQRQAGGGGIAASGVSAPNSPAEREADALAPRAAAGFAVRAGAAPAAGLHLVRYRVGDQVLAQRKKQATILSVLEPEDAEDGLQQYMVRILATGEEMKLRGGSLGPVSTAPVTVAGSSSSGLRGGGNNNNNNNASVAREGEQQGVADKQIVIAPPAAPRFVEMYDKLKLGAQLAGPLRHDAQTAAAPGGSSNNLQGKLGELMAQDQLTALHPGREVTMGLKLGTAEQGRVTELGDIDHMIARRGPGGLIPEKLVETKAGNEIPGAAATQVQKHRTVLKKAALRQDNVEIYGTGADGKANINDVRTGQFDLSDLAGDLQSVDVGTAGPKREGGKQFDTQLLFSVAEMAAFTQYVVTRFKALP